MECVLRLRCLRRHYAERRGEKERRTDNHLRRETEQEDREKVAEAEASSSFSFPLSTSCLLLIPFHGPKRRGGRGKMGRPLSSSFPLSCNSHSTPFFLVPKGPASLSQTRAPFFRPPRAREEKYSNLPHVSFSQAKAKYVLGKVTFSLTVFGTNVVRAKLGRSSCTLIFGAISVCHLRRGKKTLISCPQKIMQLSPESSDVLSSPLSLPRKSKGRRGNQDIAKDETC